MMKYMGRDVKKPRYKIGTYVSIKILKSKPIGKITKDEYDFYSKSWKYKVKTLEGTAKFWSEKSLRKVKR